MDCFGKANTAKEEPIIKSLYDKMNEKNVEWIANRYMCDEEGVENKYLIIDSKDGYEFIIEVDEPNNIAKIIWADKKSGKVYKQNLQISKVLQFDYKY